MNGYPAAQIRNSLPKYSQAPPSSPPFVSWRADKIDKSTPLCASLSTLPPLLPACPSSAYGLFHSRSVMPSTVAPCCPVQSPTLRKNVLTTCSQASRSSQGVALSIWISGIPPPPSEDASSLAIDPGLFPGHSWWSTRSTATTAAPPEVRRANCRPHCHSTSGFLDWNQGNPKTKS